MRKVISAALVLMMLVSVFSINIRAGKAEAVKGWQDEAKTIGVAMTEPAEFSVLGHWLAKDQFVKVTDWYEDKKPVYMQRIAPVDDEGIMAVYNKGEHVVFNYDLYESFTADEIKFLAEDVEVAAYLFGAEKKEGETGEFKLLNEYRGYASSVSADVEVPYDNFVAAVVFVVENADLAEFGAFVTFSSIENNYKALEANDADMNGIAVDLTAESMKAVVLPANNTYAIANAAAYKMTFDGAKTGTAAFTTDDITGFRGYFLDENMNVISQTVATGTEGDREATLTVNPMMAGTYYLVVAGNNLDNQGTVNVKFDIKDADATITDIDLTNQVDDIVVDKPGTYRFTGENNGIKIYAGSAVHVILEDAQVGGIVLINDAASVVIESRGGSYVNAQAEGYGITNAEGATAGLYIIGEALKVTAAEKTVGAILVHDAPLTIDLLNLNVKANAVEGYYPVGLWVIGKNMPTLTLGKDMKLNKDLKVADMMYSEYFRYGYTIAKDATLYAAKDPDFTKAAASFVLGKYLLGDVNMDGDVDTLDVTAILEYCADMRAFIDVELYLADTNYDFKVNTVDAAVLLRYFALIIDEI